MNELMMYFYSAISMFAHGTLQQFAGDFGQTTLSSLQFFFEGDLADAPNMSPTLCDKCVGSLTSPTNQYQEDAGDRAYGFLS